MENTATLAGLPLPAQTQTRTQARTENQTPSAEDERLLGDLSFAQVIATALAGATSFALSDKIGIAGSLIGAAIGTVVTVVGSQVFKQIIRKSAHKLGDLVQRDENPKGSDAAEMPVLSKANKLQHRWRIAVCLIACAISSVFVYAAIVSFATNGEGIGTKPHSAPEQATEATSVCETEATSGDTVAKPSDAATTPGESETPAPAEETKDQAPTVILVPIEAPAQTGEEAPGQPTTDTETQTQDAESTEAAADESAETAETDTAAEAAPAEDASELPAESGI